MEIINTHDAKTHLSKLLEKVERGEEFIIARAGKPIAKLSAIEQNPQQPKSRLGLLRGQIQVNDDWDSAEANKDIEHEFYEGHPDDPLREYMVHDKDQDGFKKKP